MKSCDIAVSLLPATMHIPLAEEAVRQGEVVEVCDHSRGRRKRKSQATERERMNEVLYVIE
jgi:hypothetical protein